MKRALVLSGGGSKGAFQAAVIDYVTRVKKLDFQIIRGVSVGALNGTMTAMGKVERLMQIWNNIENNQVYTGKLNWFTAVKALFGSDSIYGNGPLWKLIQEEVDPNLIPPTMDFAVGCVDLVTGEYLQADRSHTEFKKYVLASTVMPVIWKPVQVGRQLLVDGGVRNISPLGDVIDQGPDEIVIINCNTPEIGPHTGKLDNMLKIGARSISIMTNEIAFNDVDNFMEDNYFAEQTPTLLRRNGHYNKHFKCYLVEPTISLGDTLDFSQPSVQIRIQHGYKRAKEVFG